jgi:hypothetical protein
VPVRVLRVTHKSVSPPNMLLCACAAHRWCACVCGGGHKCADVIHGRPGEDFRGICIGGRLRRQVIAHPSCPSPTARSLQRAYGRGVPACVPLMCIVPVRAAEHRHSNVQAPEAGGSCPWLRGLATLNPAAPPSPLNHSLADSCPASLSPSPPVHCPETARGAAGLWWRCC